MKLTRREREREKMGSLKERIKGEIREVDGYEFRFKGEEAFNSILDTIDEHAAADRAMMAKMKDWATRLSDFSLRHNHTYPKIPYPNCPFCKIIDEIESAVSPDDRAQA